MRLVKSFIAHLTFALLVPHFVQGRNITAVCEHLSRVVSQATKVFYPGSSEYLAGIDHWNLASTQNATCSVEPGSVKDVQAIIKVIGSTRTPFAVKSGGHTSNLGFSSTTGIQISLARFSNISYNAADETVDVGAGLVWDKVYAYLEPLGRVAVGGRVKGVGVGGFILGGGYSWVTNQHGLALDNVVSFELVTPTGQLLHVSKTSNPDLFFALKGCHNNFGIVTRFKLKVYPQEQVWGGVLTYNATSEILPQVNTAIVDFDSNTDPKAELVMSYASIQGSLVIYLSLFYDGPVPPAGLFDAFLGIPNIAENISTRSFTSLIGASGDLPIEIRRGVSSTVPVLANTHALLDAMLNQTQYWGGVFANSPGYISFAAEPFLPTMLSHGSGPSAYPPRRDRAYLPLNLWWSWGDPTQDGLMLKSARESTEFLKAQVIASGQDIADAPQYPNYALADTTLRELYGDNVGRLKRIKKGVDPANVMGLAGGYKL